MTDLPEGKQHLQEKLYVNGFLITDYDFEPDDGYPFYGNWTKVKAHELNILVHKNAQLTTFVDNNAFFFMIGHAVDPFEMLREETAVLEKLASAFRKSVSAYYEAQADLTGVFCTGVIVDRKVYISNDCPGMQIVMLHHYSNLQSHTTAPHYGDAWTA